MWGSVSHTSVAVGTSLARHARKPVEPFQSRVRKAAKIAHDMGPRDQKAYTTPPRSDSACAHGPNPRQGAYNSDKPVYRSPPAKGDNHEGRHPWKLSPFAPGLSGMAALLAAPRNLKKSPN